MLTAPQLRSVDRDNTLQLSSPCRALCWDGSRRSASDGLPGVLAQHRQRVCKWRWPAPWRRRHTPETGLGALGRAVSSVEIMSVSASRVVLLPRLPMGWARVAASETHTGRAMAGRVAAPRERKWGAAFRESSGHGRSLRSTLAQIAAVDLGGAEGGTQPNGQP
jgi:hypothetical protein